MAEEEEEQTEEEEEEKSGGSKKLIIIIVVVVLLVGIGVATFLVMGSGDEESDDGTADLELTAEDEDLFDLPGATLPLDTFIVNLKVKGSFLKVTIQLEFEQPELPPTIESDIPKVRDTVIRSLSNKSAGEILSLEGKEELSLYLIDAINETLGAEDVVNLYFTEFIIQ